MTRTDLHRCYSPISFTVIRTYLAYMEANGYRNVLSLKMFGLGLPVMLKEYGLNYEKRHTKQGIQTNLTLKEESYGDWLPKCDAPATT